MLDYFLKEDKSVLEDFQIIKSPLIKTKKLTSI